MFVYWKQPEFHSAIVLHQNTRHASFSPNRSIIWNKANDTSYNSPITRFHLGFTNHLPTKKHSNNEVVALALFNITCCDYMLVLKHQLSSYYTHTANLHHISRLPHSLCTALRAHIFSQKLRSWWMSWLPKQHCNVKNFLASSMIFDTCYLYASDFN